MKKTKTIRTTEIVDFELDKTEVAQAILVHLQITEETPTAPPARREVIVNNDGSAVVTYTTIMWGEE